MRYKILDADLEKIMVFVGKRLNDAHLYNTRGAFKEEDLLVGAYAEYATYYYLRELGLHPTLPNLNYISPNSKSYEADITAGEWFFHVKGQSTKSSDKYGFSWLLQKNDPIVKETKDNHTLVLCNVDIVRNLTEIKCIIPTNVIHNIEGWQEPKVEHLKDTKVALYLDYIKTKLEDRWVDLY